jgi:hypothetical protein
MKRNTALRAIAAMIIIAAVAAAVPVYAVIPLWAADMEPATISISGTGAVDVPPDMATVVFTVRTEDEQSTAAQRDNSRIMGRLLAAMEDEGIYGEDIRTVNFSLREVFAWTNNVRHKTGYEVTASVRVTMRDIDRIGYVLSAANAAGVTSTGNVVFSISDTNAVFNEALALATRSAMIQAAAVAEALGMRVIGVRTVTVVGGQHRPVLTAETPPMAAPAGGAAAAPPPPPPILAGDLTVSATVSITFVIAP